MPLYEYKCENCGEVFEVRQNFSDEPVAVHEKCGGRVNRLISTSAFNFKGSGWYATDYAKGGNSSKKTESESNSSTESAAKPETKPAESKPATSDKSKTE
jgi:putative FmdB family regulatory protein